MSALLQHPVPGWAAHGGLDVLEPACAYDAFVELVRGLLDLGYRPDPVARMVRARWKAMIGPDVYERMPHEVERMLGDAARRAMIEADDEARRLYNVCYRRHKRKKRKPTGRPVGTPRVYDRDAIRDDIIRGLSNQESAARHGCHTETVRKERIALGMPSFYAQTREERGDYVTNVQRYTLQRAATGDHLVRGVGGWFWAQGDRSLIGYGTVASLTRRGYLEQREDRTWIARLTPKGRDKAERMRAEAKRGPRAEIVEVTP